MNKIYGTSLLAITLLLGACKEEAQQAAPPTAVSVIKVVQTDLPIYKEYVGSIYGYKDIPIRARVEGFLETIDFEEGTRVNEGQLLYTIDSQPFAADVAAAQSKVAEAETKLVNAENELARYKPLADSKAVSQSDVDAAQATRDAAEASLHAAEANLEMSQINLGYATMRSPINGIIGKTSARVGEYVGKDPNPVILNTVSRLDTVRVQFFLPEAQYLSVVRSYIQEKNSAMHIEIGGHTDNKGSVSYNQKLSENRANSVYDYLVKQGIPAERLAYKGYNFSEPIESNDTPEGRAKNRRTEFKITKVE